MHLEQPQKFAAQFDQRFAGGARPALVVSRHLILIPGFQSHCTDTIHLVQHRIDAHTLQSTFHHSPITGEVPEIVLQRQKVCILHASVPLQPRLRLGNGIVTQIFAVGHRHPVLAQLTQDVVRQLICCVGHRNRGYFPLHLQEFLQCDGVADLPCQPILLVLQHQQAVVPLGDVLGYDLQFQPVI